MKLASRIFRDSPHYITSKFGHRPAVYDDKGNLVAEEGDHNGTDYGTHGNKVPQYALEDGIVLSAGKDISGALFAWVRYPRLGIDLLHYHLDSVKVTKGQTVNSETIIGNTGKTGWATGVHLHLGLRKVGSTKYYDPEGYDYIEYVAPPVIVEPPVVIEPIQFRKGDQVVPTRLVNYTGVKLTQYDKVYTVYENPHNDRIVLAANRHGKLIVWAAMNIKDVRRA